MSRKGLSNVASLWILIYVILLSVQYYTRTKNTFGIIFRERIPTSYHIVESKKTTILKRVV